MKLCKDAHNRQQELPGLIEAEPAGPVDAGAQILPVEILHDHISSSVKFQIIADVDYSPAPRYFGQ